MANAFAKPKNVVAGDAVLSSKAPKASLGGQERSTRPLGQCQRERIGQGQGLNKPLVPNCLLDSDAIEFENFQS